MTARAVHWHEGMFLRPHQLQAAQRFAAASAREGDKTDHYYNWGLRSLDLNRSALDNHRFEVRALQARFRDGTVLTVPDDATLPALDLRPAFEKEQFVTVYLALPVLHSGRANVVAAAQAESGRFQFVEQELEDDNTGLNPQPVQLLLPNVRLLLSTDNLQGYELLEVARVQKVGPAGSFPRLDASYFPPVLSTKVWVDLNALIVRIYDELGRRIHGLATHVLVSGIPIDSAAAGEAKLLTQLRALNEAYTLLNVLAFAEGVHPLTTYAELCRLVGRLAIYGPERRPPALPRYDHDDLGRCFVEVAKHIFALLHYVELPAYERRPFKGAGLQMQVAIEKQEWLLPAAFQLFVGVETESLRHEQVDALLTRGLLAMKIGSSGTVEGIWQRRFGGLEFQFVPDPPRVLPRERLTYFRIDRGKQEQEWANVQQTLSLALRVDDKQVVGVIQDQSTLKVKLEARGASDRAGPTADLTFFLFVVPA